MDTNGVYEKLAAQFKKETGLLAPGKDAPAAVAGCPEYAHEYRLQEWDKWIASHCTLTQMLWVSLLNSDEILGDDYKALEGAIEVIKGTFKTWLAQVGLPSPSLAEDTRKLSVTLVDEPGPIPL